MEDAIYYVTIAAVIVFGLYSGKRLARSMGEAVLIGLGGTTIAVVAFLCLIVACSPSSPPTASTPGESASGWGRCSCSARHSGWFRRSVAGDAPRKPPPGCFNGRNARLPESRPAT